MDQLSNVLTVDVTERPPLTPGDHFIREDLYRKSAAILDTRYHSGGRSGRVLHAHFSDDFSLVINDGLWATACPFESVLRADGLYLLSLRLSGKCLESVNQNTYTLGALTCSMIYYTDEVRHVFRLLPDEPLVEVCVVFHLSFIMRKYRMTAAEAEALLHPPAHRALDPWFNQCPMTPELEAVIRTLRATSPFSKSWWIFAEAKVLEALFLYLKQLEERALENAALKHTSQDLRRLHTVRQYLRKHYRDSPRIDDLCRLAGLNRRKLTEGFKAEFGHTVFGYIQYLRLEDARALFQNGLTDVNRVAHQVGYAHQSNFAKAFKQYFGISPSECCRMQRHIRQYGVK